MSVALWNEPFSVGLDVECILRARASLVPGISNVADRLAPLIDLCPSGQVCITVGCQRIHYAL